MPSGGEGEALGRSRGGFSTKVHLRAEGGGRPITAVLTGGERHEQIVLEALLDRGAIPAGDYRGRPSAGHFVGTSRIPRSPITPGLTSRRLVPHLSPMTYQDAADQLHRAAEAIRATVSRLLRDDDLIRSSS